MSYKAKLNEIGGGVNIAYLTSRNYLAPAFHLHYSRYLTDYFSIGLGHEAIFDNHKHNAFTAEASLKLFGGLILTVKPGVTTKQYGEKIEVLYIVGLETEYEFKLNDEIHFGPMFQINSVQDDVHVLAGFHMGFNF